MMIRSLVALTLLTLSAGSAFAAEPIYLVRHAEKVLQPKTDDPLLTEAGTRRAAQLARVLRTANLRAIYTTQYKRTQLTVEPLAKALGLKLSVVDAKQVKELAAELAKQQGAVLVSGHSNTLPDIIKELGIKEEVKIDDADYDNLFVVIRGDRGEALKLLRLHFGD